MKKLSLLAALFVSLAVVQAMDADPRKQVKPASTVKDVQIFCRIPGPKVSNQSPQTLIKVPQSLCVHNLEKLKKQRIEKSLVAFKDLKNPIHSMYPNPLMIKRLNLAIDPWNPVRGRPGCVDLNISFLRNVSFFLSRLVNLEELNLILQLTNKVDPAQDDAFWIPGAVPLPTGFTRTITESSMIFIKANTIQTQTILTVRLYQARSLTFGRHINCLFLEK